MLRWKMKTNMKTEKIEDILKRFKNGEKRITPVKDPGPMKKIKDKNTPYDALKTVKALSHSGQRVSEYYEETIQ